MKKQLITENSLQSFCKGDQLILTDSMILTPSALDKVKELGVVLQQDNRIAGEEDVEKAVEKTGEEPVEMPVEKGRAPEAGTTIQDSSHDFLMPSMSLLGFGCLDRAVTRIRRMNHRKALLVTDAILAKVGVVATVIEQFEKKI